MVAYTVAWWWVLFLEDRWVLEEEVYQVQVDMLAL